MITQERFDKAYHRIADLRDEVTTARRLLFATKDQHPGKYYDAYGHEKGLSQALAVLEEADSM